MNVNLSSLKRLRECLWRKPRVRPVREPTPACIVVDTPRVLPGVEKAFPQSFIPQGCLSALVK